MRMFITLLQCVLLEIFPRFLPERMVFVLLWSPELHHKWGEYNCGDPDIGRPATDTLHWSLYTRQGKLVHLSRCERQNVCLCPKQISDPLQRKIFKSLFRNREVLQALHSICLMWPSCTYWRGFRVYQQWLLGKFQQQAMQGPKKAMQVSSDYLEDCERFVLLCQNHNCCMNHSRHNALQFRPIFSDSGHLWLHWHVQRLHKVQILSIQPALILVCVFQSLVFDTALIRAIELWGICCFARNYGSSKVNLTLCLVLNASFPTLKDTTFSHDDKQ